MISTQQHTQIIQQHAKVFQRKIAAAIAFTTTIFLLWIEDVKAFTATHSFFNENTILFLASGAHSLAKRWRSTSGSFAIPPVLRTTREEGIHQTFPSGASTSQSAGFGTSHCARSFTSLRMSTPSAPMLDMKTSLNAFGGWYNKMEPLARPPIYDE